VNRISGYEVVNVPDLLVEHRFRPRSQFSAFRHSISDILIRNALRFACLYLPEDLLLDTYDYYLPRLGEDFERTMDELVAEGVWERRAQLARTFCFDFNWYARRFDLRSAQAALSA
jgi:hypothetical protein